MKRVTLPQKFGKIPISIETLINLGLLEPNMRQRVITKGYQYTDARHNTQVVTCWNFPLNPKLVYEPGNGHVDLNENGIRTSKWLKAATHQITTPSGQILINWVLHQVEGAFIVQFFDWVTERDRSLLEL